MSASPFVSDLDMGCLVLWPVLSAKCNVIEYWETAGKIEGVN